MKPSKLIRLLSIFALCCAAQVALAKPPAISLAGGDGSSLEKAIVIKGATEETGVHAEYEYLRQHFPGYKRGSQSLQNAKGHAYDVLEFTTADGMKRTIYFDITAFFGK
ncbi:MAG TPA: hypothetical protein VGO11_19115 [Chthoniobacteraceae bacterium]|jgi:hypothetical protein|nr:hypothetical protein [Chthoniobacteraceae bacterium]